MITPRRGGPPRPPDVGGFIVWLRMICLRGVSGSGRHQDDRVDHQPPPGAWFPQSREYTVLSCARQANSPGRLCLRPPPNTPFRAVRCFAFRSIRLPRMSELLITTAFSGHVAFYKFMERSNALDAYLERGNSVGLQRIRISSKRITPSFSVR